MAVPGKLATNRKRPIQGQIQLFKKPRFTRRETIMDSKELFQSVHSRIAQTHGMGSRKKPARGMLLLGIPILSAAWMVAGCEGPLESDSGGNVHNASAKLDPLASKYSESRHESTRFFTPPPQPAAVAQIASLVRQHAFGKALRLAEMETTPRAVWVLDGTPQDARSFVKKTMDAAERQRRVPILIAYNLPFRDCAQYSSGGATDTAAYEAWIDGFARGIGDREAAVILEPDSLGVIPYNTMLDGTEEWCRPTITNDQGNIVPAPGATPAARYAQLNYAVASLKANAPRAAVYLDGTHSAWLSSGEAAYRLNLAGVAQARGFFLNVSNYQPTPQLIKYGTWVAKCLYFANNPAEGGWRLGHYDYCASQYYPATASDFSTWPLTDAWYADNVDHAANPPVGSFSLHHFMIDTGRNGQGPLNATVYAAAPYNQPASVIGGLNAGNWCNAAGAGLGLPTTADTGVPLLDAYAWLKTPGESDGTCDIAGGARAWDYDVYNPWGVVGDQQNHFDPLWGMVAPVAGTWFPEQALELAMNANPPLHL